MIFSVGIFSQTLYRSKATGNWNARETWEVSTNNGVNWGAASVTPIFSNCDGITIRSPHTVTIATANRTADEIIIDPGGQVTINSPHIFTINNGIGTDLTVNGTLVNSGTLTINSGASVIFESGSTYQHAKDGGTIPPATWNANSTCSITGLTGTIPFGWDKLLDILPGIASGKPTA